MTDQNHLSAWLWEGRSRRHCARVALWPAIALCSQHNQNAFLKHTLKMAFPSLYFIFQNCVCFFQPSVTHRQSNVLQISSLQPWITSMSILRMYKLQTRLFLLTSKQFYLHFPSFNKPNLCLSLYLTNLMHKIRFTISFISCHYMFRAHVLIIRRSKLHYTAT